MYNKKCPKIFTEPLLWANYHSNKSINLTASPLFKFKHNKTVSLIRFLVKLLDRMKYQAVVALLFLALLSFVYGSGVVDASVELSEQLDGEITAVNEVSGITDITPPSESEGLGRLFIPPTPSPTPLPISCSSLDVGVASPYFDGDADSSTCFYMDSPPGTYEVNTTGYGDLDLYVLPEWTNTSELICGSYSFTGYERCIFNVLEEGRTYFEVYGYDNYINATISYTKYEDPNTGNCVKISEGDTTFDISYSYNTGPEEKCFYADVPISAKGYNVTTTALGDVDLYTGLDYRPTWFVDTCGTYSYSGNETCSGPVGNTKKLFIVLEGYDDISNGKLNLKFEHKEGIAYRFLPFISQVEAALGKRKKEKSSVDDAFYKLLK